MSETVPVHRITNGDRTAYRVYDHNAIWLGNLWESKHGGESTVRPVQVSKDDLVEVYGEEGAERTWCHWTTEEGEGGHGL